MPVSAFGVGLRKLREKRGLLSLRELARLAGIDHAYLHRLETGEKADPSEEIMAKLIRALKASKRDAELLRYLIRNPMISPDLVEFVLEDPSITAEEYPALAGVAFRGTARPDYRTLLKRVRLILGTNGDG